MGKGVDDVAAAAAGKQGCRGDAATMGRLKTLTAGMPLFVRSAATIAREDYEGRIEQMCDAVDALTNLTRTARSSWRRSLARSPLSAQQTIAVLSLSDIGLLPAGINKFLDAALDMDERAVAGVIRILRAAGVGKDLHRNERSDCMTPSVLSGASTFQACAFRGRVTGSHCPQGLDG